MRRADLKSVTFNLHLEPSGTVQACTGIALPVRLPLLHIAVHNCCMFTDIHQIVFSSLFESLLYKKLQFSPFVPFVHFQRLFPVIPFLSLSRMVSSALDRLAGWNHVQQ
jgi:hypothetical protein